MLDKYTLYMTTLISRQYHVNITFHVTASQAVTIYIKMITDDK
jgi:hypothetical protein